MTDNLANISIKIKGLILIIKFEVLNQNAYFSLKLLSINQSRYLYFMNIVIANLFIFRVQDLKLNFITILSAHKCEVFSVYFYLFLRNKIDD